MAAIQETEIAKYWMRSLLQVHYLIFVVEPLAAKLQLTVSGDAEHLNDITMRLVCIPLGVPACLHNALGLGDVCIVFRELHNMIWYSLNYVVRVLSPLSLLGFIIIAA